MSELKNKNLLFEPYVVPTGPDAPTGTRKDEYDRYAKAKNTWNDYSNQILENEATGDDWNPWLRIQRALSEYTQLKPAEYPIEFPQGYDPVSSFRENPMDTRREASFYKRLLEARKLYKKP